MNDFKWQKIWRVTEKITVGLVMSSVILCIAMQVIMTRDNLRGYFDIAQSWNGTELDTTLPVVQDDTALFGNIVIEVPNFTTLPDAKVLVNGVESGSFKENQVTVRVYAGDVIEIDSSAYEKYITYAIVRASANINTKHLNEQVTVKGGKANMGSVLFR